MFLERLRGWYRSVYEPAVTGKKRIKPQIYDNSSIHMSANLHVKFERKKTASHLCALRVFPILAAKSVLDDHHSQEECLYGKVYGCDIDSMSYEYTLFGA